MPQQINSLDVMKFKPSLSVAIGNDRCSAPGNFTLSAIKAGKKALQSTGETY